MWKRRTCGKKLPLENWSDLLQLWKERTPSLRLPEPGKQPGECLRKSRQGHCQHPVGVRTLGHMSTPTHTNRAAYTVGKLNNKTIRILLDSGASCSVILADYACKSEIKPITTAKLVNTDGRNIIPHRATTMTVTLADYSVKQSFLVVEHLSIPDNLGYDYLTINGFILNFKQGTFHRTENPMQRMQLLPAESPSCHLITMDDDCPQAIPNKHKDHKSTVEDMPNDVHPSLIPLLDEFKELFSQ